MAHRVTAPIPPLDYQRYQVDVQISIWRRGDRYTAYIQSEGGNPYQVPIDLTPQEVQALNSDLQQAVSKGMLIDATDTCLRELAEKGNAAYKQLFKDEAARRTMQSALKLASKGGVIQITSDDFALPWDLLYDHDVTSPLSFERFWGMRYIVSRVRVVRSRPTDFAPPTISTSRPKLGLLDRRQVGAVANKEMPFFSGLHGQGRIRLLKLRPLDQHKRLAEMKTFIGFWKKKLDLARCCLPCLC